ncbi:restriction endonuclease subunit S [Segatella sp.]|uniref:restriction endonuclease subunit S n=1 Tax=Segatella sp. TaxID=2974253 RepID=UPI00307F2DFB
MWTTLGEIGSWQSGATPSRMNKDYYGGNIPWLKTGDLNDGTITYIPEYITQRALEETSVRLNPKGSVLIAMYGATIGKIGILSFPATTNQACCACYEYSINQMFLFYFLLANRENFIAMGGGGAQPNISKEKIISTSMPLPPLKEQERIVAEIERWLSFVDIVEKEKSDLQSTICLAKSKILDLAIHGKLVPQDPNDEPASELLKRINPKAEITCDNPQYGKLPKGWCSCTLRNVCSFTNGFAFNSDAYKNNGIPLVRISNITNEGKIDLNSCVYIQDEIDEQYIIEKGDFLVAMSGATTGKMGVYTYGEISYLNQRVGKIKASKALYTPYMHYLMYSQVDNILKMAYGGAQPNISAKAILAIRILLPPLAEQQRIVAKIEDLFTQLDKIEASL